MRTTTPNRRQRARLQIEPLESRTVPASAADMNFLTQAYRDLIGVEPTPSALFPLAQRMESGTSSWQIAYDLSQQLEHKQFVVRETFGSILGRPPTTDELSQWVNASYNGKTYTDLRKAVFANTDYSTLHCQADTREYVSNLYLEAFGRPADLDGFNWWLSRAEAGNGRLVPSMLDWMLSYPEFYQFEVHLFYQRYLRREVDAQALQDFAPPLANGADPNPTFLVGSPEYYAACQTKAWPALPTATQNQTFVTQLYGDMLGRAPAQDELDHWTSSLAANVSREQVAQQVQQTTEFRALEINQTYQSLLGRAPTTQEMSQWQTLLVNRSVTTLEAEILWSDEYYTTKGGTDEGFLNGLYHDVLGRAIDPSGADTFGKSLLLHRQIAGHTDTGWEVGVVITSSEAHDVMVQRLYQRLFQRQPDAYGLNYWSNMLDQPDSALGQTSTGWTREAVFSGLVSSEEYL